jgi:Pup-like protein
MKQAQRKHRKTTTGDAEEPQRGTAEAQQEKLDENVACCLADIDAVLEGQESEEDRAIREFSELHAQVQGATTVEAALAARRALDEWHVRYAHLGLTVCCGVVTKKNQ